MGNSAAAAAPTPSAAPKLPGIPGQPFAYPAVASVMLPLVSPTTLSVLTAVCADSYALGLSSAVVRFDINTNAVVADAMLRSWPTTY